LLPSAKAYSLSGSRPGAEKLRILILNWRCPRNPNAGGAEAVTFEIAKRLVESGHSVEWFSAGFQGAAATESVAGIRIVRRGRQWTVHWSAYRHYRRRLRASFDVVVDETNTIPFFTPLWADIPHVLFIHQLAREVWWYEAVFPLSLIGYLMEPLYLRLYRKTPAITVSESTRGDLAALGIRTQVYVIPDGIDPVAQKEHRGTTPSFLYVGRLARSKRVLDIIRAFAIFRAQTGIGDLTIVGSGNERYTRRLRSEASRLNLTGAVRFVGALSEADKYRQMASAHMLLVASVREGWGLVVTEANSCGTPAVGYDVPGIRDSIVDRVSGLLSSSNPPALAEAMLLLWRDNAMYQRLSQEARSRSRAYTHEASAQAFASAVGQLVAFDSARVSTA
jgi:glycosyltransferase involved in cell wall biosynthesis